MIVKYNPVLWHRLGVSVTLLEENIDHLTHGTTGLITWQVRYSKEEESSSTFRFIGGMLPADCKWYGLAKIPICQAGRRLRFFPSLNTMYTTA